MKKPAINKILLAGSTGYIGSNVLRVLLSKGYHVVCIGRNFSFDQSTKKHDNLSVFKTDICKKINYEFLKKQFSSLDGIISCIGTRSGGQCDSWKVEYQANKNLLELGVCLGIKQYILLSAICVQKPKLHFQFAKLAFENELISSGVSYSIVRPTAYFKSLAGQIEKVKSGKPFVLFDNGVNTSCKPISKRDLAEFICSCLFNDARKGKVMPIGGPGLAYTPMGQGELIFKILKQSPKFRSVPSSIFKIFGYCLTPLSHFSNRIKNLREFSRIGHYYATESMLVWDESQQAYSSAKTPEYGNDSLEDFYKQVIKFGIDGHELGKHKLFKN